MMDNIPCRNCGDPYSWVDNQDGTYECLTCYNIQFVGHEDEDPECE